MARAGVERKRDVLGRLPVVFGLSEAEAAAAVGIGVTFFRQLVAERRMPQPRSINSRRVWDVDELRVAFKALPHDIEAAETDTWADVV